MHSLLTCFIVLDFQLMGDEPDLDPEISRSFFEGNILKLDPSLLTENGIRFVIQNKLILLSSVSDNKIIC